MKYSLLPLLIILGLLGGACEKNKTEPKKEETAKCDSTIFCTMELKSLFLDVKDPNGQVVVLDKVVSTRSNGEEFSFKREPFIGMETSGRYAFWSDNQFESTNKTGENIVVKGIRNNQEIFRRNFKVGHDCCHVLLIEGNTNATIPLPE